MINWIEPKIIINDIELTFSQAMVVRVAIANFHTFVLDNKIDLGIPLANAYNKRLIEIIQLISKNNK